MWGVAALLLAGMSQSKDLPKSQSQIDDKSGYRERPYIPARDLPGAYPGVQPAPASVDTTEMGFWGFEGGTGVCDAQGWTTFDRTRQTGDYFHVDDFAGLGGGDFGRLVPLEGSQSLWCGTRANAIDFELCGYATLPGYGNNWNQSFCTASYLDFLVTWDSEPWYDFTYVEYDQCDDDWQEQFAYEGIGTGFASHVVGDSLHTGDVRLRIRFDSDKAWSDQDGSWPTDGGVIVDSLTVRDASGVVLPTELFEVETVGANDAASGNWVSCNTPGYGDFAALFWGMGVEQGRSDQCVSNISCLWGFFNGSTYDFSCGGFPQQAVIPYMNTRGEYIRNEVWSPLIPLPAYDIIQIQFDEYYDHIINALVFGLQAVRSVVDGCPGPWYVFDGNFDIGTNGWETRVFSIGSLIETGATHIQVMLGIRDFCYPLCGLYGDGTCHSHAPLYDNVRLYALDVNSPKWVLRDQDMFQDTFSTNGTVTGTARADMAADIRNPVLDPVIQPGDSVVVTVEYPGGLDTDSYTATGPAAYLYLSVRPQGQPGKAGDALSGDPLRWPVVDSFLHNGDTWHCVRMDTVYDDHGDVVADRYCVDLNDNLFTPGDTVFFVFAAKSGAPDFQYSYATLAPLEYGSRYYQSDDLAWALDNADEFTVLPAGGYERGGEMLYVDGMNLRGAQPFFEWTFQMLKAAPEASVGNHPASRVYDVFQQIVPIYSLIYWNTGDLGTAFSDGSGTPDKSDDTGLLFTFMNNKPGTGGGVYLSGDDVADVWRNTLTSMSATMLRTTYMNFNVVSGDHAPAVGVSPYAVGDPAGVYWDAYGVDSVIVFGGCPRINDFDVLEPLGTAITQMSYHGKGNTAGAFVSQATPNAATPANTVGFLLSGFSYHEVRDVTPAGVPVRAEHFRRTRDFFADGPMHSPTGTDPAGAVNALHQNHPNPFNPTTTIHYSIAQAGHVSLRVYNVAGQ
jgi:hypothetical protein